MRRVTITEDVNLWPMNFMAQEEKVREQTLQQDDKEEMAPFLFLTILGMLIVILSLYKSEIIQLFL